MLGLKIRTYPKSVYQGLLKNVLTFNPMWLEGRVAVILTLYKATYIHSLSKLPKNVNNWLSIDFQSVSTFNHNPQVNCIFFNELLYLVLTTYMHVYEK